jgi:hypothetical protein
MTKHEHGRAGAARVGGNVVRQLPDWRDPEWLRGSDQCLGCKHHLCIFLRA